ncbi:unnamed protein product [Eretmochelys imbricata]
MLGVRPPGRLRRVCAPRPGCGVGRRRGEARSAAGCAMATDITPEAIGFLSAVGVFIVLLTVLFLLINKKLCFEKIGPGSQNCKCGMLAKLNN